MDDANCYGLGFSVCLLGYYCEEGTSDPTACPPGTFGAATGLRNVTECTACTAGNYCQTPGLLSEEGNNNNNNNNSGNLYSKDEHTVLYKISQAYKYTY